MSEQAKAQIGVTGLSVMGRNLARNLARHGHIVALHNRSPERTRSLVSQHGDEGELVPSESMADFVASLRRPRAVIVMVKAGAATDEVIGELTGLLEPDDIVIDCGNTHFTDTIRREKELAARWPPSGAAAASSGPGSSIESAPPTPRTPSSRACWWPRTSPTRSRPAPRAGAG